MPSEVKQVFSSSPFLKEAGPSTEYLMTLLAPAQVKLIDDKMRIHLKNLSHTQDLITFNQAFLKEVNRYTEKDGTLTKEKFVLIIDEMRPNLETKRAKALEDAVKKDISEEEINKKFQPFFDFIDNTSKMGLDMLGSSSLFTREMKENLKDNIGMDLKDLSFESDKQMQVMSRLQNEINEFFSIAKTLTTDTIHRITMKMASHIKGG